MVTSKQSDFFIFLVFISKKFYCSYSLYLGVFYILDFCVNMDFV